MRLDSITSRLPLGAVAERVPARIADGIWAVKVLREAGVIAPMRPDKMVRVAEKFIRWGTSPALGSVAAAIDHPDRVAIDDELGQLTFSQTHLRSNALARALADAGVAEGDGVAIMCRNHRYFIEATMACSKIGAVALYLNTAFAAPQLKEVMQRESTKALIYDDEFADLLDAEDQDLRRIVGWSEGRHE